MKKIAVLLVILTLILSGCGARPELPESVGKPLVTEAPTENEMPTAADEFDFSSMEVPAFTNFMGSDIWVDDASSQDWMNSLLGEYYETAQVDYNGEAPLYIKLESATATDKGIRIALSVVNETGHIISLHRWVDAHLEVTTTEGTYYHEYTWTDIARGCGRIVVDNLAGAKGNIQKIVISDMALLDDKGFMGTRLQDVVVYDVAEGIDGFEEDFRNSVAIIALIGTLVIALVVAPIVVILAFRKTSKKKSEKENGTFSNMGLDERAGFYPPQKDAHRQFVEQEIMRQHMEAAQQVAQTHQQTVQQEIIRQQMDIAQQSAMPIDQGGFVPPPPPPGF